MPKLERQLSMFFGKSGELLDRRKPGAKVIHSHSEIKHEGRNKKKKSKEKKEPKRNPVKAYLAYEQAVRAILYNVGVTEFTITTNGAVQIIRTTKTSSFISNIGESGGVRVDTIVKDRTRAPVFDQTVAIGKRIVEEQRMKQRKKRDLASRPLPDPEGRTVTVPPRGIVFPSDIKPENLKRLYDAAQAFKNRKR